MQTSRFDEFIDDLPLFIKVIISVMVIAIQAIGYILGFIIAVISYVINNWDEMRVRGITLGTILVIIAIAIFMNHKTYNDYTPNSNYQENINTNYTDTQKQTNYIDFSNIPSKNPTIKEIIPKEESPKKQVQIISYEEAIKLEQKK